MSSSPIPVTVAARALAKWVQAQSETSQPSWRREIRVSVNVRGALAWLRAQNNQQKVSASESSEYLLLFRELIDVLTSLLCVSHVALLS